MSKLHQNRNGAAACGVRGGALSPRLYEVKPEHRCKRCWRAVGGLSPLAKLDQIMGLVAGEDSALAKAVQAIIRY